MSVAEASEDGGHGSRTEWEGYSDYEAVSRSVAKSIDDAVDAYAWLQRLHREDASVRPRAAANASADVLAAALRLYVEMQQEHEEGNDDYDEILARWGYDVADDDEDGGPDIGTDEAPKGFISALHEGTFQSGLPSWMLELVTDIRTAGWKLGYLQAGRRSKKSSDDPVEEDVDTLMEGR